MTRWGEFDQQASQQKERKKILNEQRCDASEIFCEKHTEDIYGTHEIDSDRSLFHAFLDAPFDPCDE